MTSRNTATPIYVWQKRAVESTSVNMEQLSDFYFKLEPKVKTRYLEKITHIRKDDPYALKRSDFCQDESLLPALR